MHSGYWRRRLPKAWPDCRYTVYQYKCSSTNTMTAYFSSWYWVIVLLPHVLISFNLLVLCMLNKDSATHDKPRLVIDMDEVMADTLHKFLTLYHRDFGIAMDSHQAPGKELHENLPEHLNGQWKIYANEKGFFRDIPPMPGAIETIKALQTRY